MLWVWCAPFGQLIGHRAAIGSFSASFEMVVDAATKPWAPGGEPRDWRNLSWPTVRLIHPQPPSALARCRGRTRRLAKRIRAIVQRRSPTRSATPPPARHCRRFLISTSTRSAPSSHHAASRSVADGIRACLRTIRLQRTKGEPVDRPLGAADDFPRRLASTMRGLVDIDISHRIRR